MANILCMCRLVGKTVFPSVIGNICKVSAGSLSKVKFDFWNNLKNNLPPFFNIEFLW